MSTPSGDSAKDLREILANADQARGLTGKLNEALEHLQLAVAAARAARDFGVAGTTGQVRVNIEQAITRMEDAESALVAARPLTSSRGVTR
jgi:hypothetical protein